MAHAVAGVAKRCPAQPARDVHPPRPCLVRVSAPRLEQVEPSPPDEVPVTRARYTAGAFAPPATRVVLSDVVRTGSPARGGAQHSSQKSGDDGPFQRTAPLTDKQLEEYSTAVLSASSSIWSAEARNQPASTSQGIAEDEELRELLLRDNKSARTLVRILDLHTEKGDVEAVLRILQDCDQQTLVSVLRRWYYKRLLKRLLVAQKARPAVQFAKFVLPHVGKPEVLLTKVLQVCAQGRDIEAGLGIVDWARKAGVRIDEGVLTTLIKVCKSVGNVDRAFRVYQEMRAANHRLDGYVFGALIAAHAEAMKRDLTVVHERKDQYVLLERAFQLVEDADRSNVALAAPVWNALIMCAGRSGETNRAFEALQMMSRRGVEPTASTFGALMESCVCVGHSERALRVYEVAMQKGFTSEVQLYTQAVSACMRPFPGAWERALEIYATMQRAAVRPDKKFFACLIAVAGRAGRLDTAFELLTEMAAEGIQPSSTSMSALIHACLDLGNLTLARRVYDLCARQGVYPVLSQFNHLMDVYASEFRFGEVVSLLSDMVAAGRQPNLNTYRILIDACAFTDQGGLAFQVFALMHANKVKILQEKFAQTIYFMLIKACFNQTRFLWSPPLGYPPNADSVLGPAAASRADTTQQQPALPASASAADNGAGPSSAPVSEGEMEADHSAHARIASSDGASSSSSSVGVNGVGGATSHRAQQQQQLLRHVPGLHPHPQNVLGRPQPERRLEAEKVLAALGSHKLRRGQHQSDPFEGPPDTIDWASHAISAFHHMITRGFRPTLELLDVLLNCMRAKMLPTDDAAAAGDSPGGVPGSRSAGAGQYLAPFVPRRSRDAVFEVAFEPRAFGILDEAINRGLLPRYDLDSPLVIDMRRMPPVVAEVYVLHILSTLERRAKWKSAQDAKAAAAAAAAAVSSGGGAGAAAAAAAAAKHISSSPRQSYHQPITLLVPSFDPDLVKWPSYTTRLMNKYTATMTREDREALRRRYRRRSRAGRHQERAARAAAAAAATAAAADGSPRDPLATGNRAAAGGDAEDLDSLTEDRYLDGVLQDPWEDEAMYGWASQENDVEEQDDGGGFEDAAGGRYVADGTTGLAVAATLQRMKVWMDMDYVNGVVTIHNLEISRFLKRRRQAALAAAEAAEERAALSAAAAAAGQRSNAPAPPPQTPLGPGAGAAAAAAAGGLMAAGANRHVVGVGFPGRGAAGSPVEQQQRNIRLGMMGGSGVGPTGRGSDGGSSGGGGFGPSTSAGAPPAAHHQQQPHGAAAGPAPRSGGWGPANGGASAAGAEGVGPGSRSRPSPRLGWQPDGAAGSSHEVANGAGAEVRTVRLSPPGRRRAGEAQPPTLQRGAASRDGSPSAAHSTSAMSPLQQQEQQGHQAAPCENGSGAAAYGHLPSNQTPALTQSWRGAATVPAQPQAEGPQSAGFVPPSAEVSVGPGPAVVLSMSVAHAAEASVGATGAAAAAVGTNGSGA